MIPNPALARVDAALVAWRTRLAAASRNIAELGELPEFTALKAAARANGGTGDAGRLVATLDELWQGVLLLNGAIDQAEAARAAAARLWMPGDLAAVSRILDGPSISVALGASPVLHRRLLGDATETVVVSPSGLLATMEGAFDTARATLERIATAAEAGTALHGRLHAAIGALATEGRPEAPDLAARLAACHAPDPVAAFDALEALRPAVDAASAAAEDVRVRQAHGAQALEAARVSLADLAALHGRAHDAIAAASPLVAGLSLPTSPPDEAELPGWLDRLERTLQSGRTEAFTKGLESWTVLATRAAAGRQRVLNGVTAQLAARDDLRGRFGALQAKHRARHPGADPALDAIAAQVRTALLGGPADLDSGRRGLAAYEASLAITARHG